jgi:hypothetical protein
MIDIQKLQILENAVKYIQYLEKRLEYSAYESINANYANPRSGHRTSKSPVKLAAIPNLVN